ncbi:DUF4878 domain-containing protein [Paenibacillus montanisoli]|nr:DUF4878 domain-containing protein [Paenibacillus montanisoli]
MAGVLTAVIVLGGGSGYILHSTSTNASQLDEKDVEQSVLNYFNAIESKNVDDMVKYSIDTRYSTEQEASRKPDYQEIMKSDIAHLNDIVKIEQNDEKNFTATLNVYTEDTGDIILKFPVTLTDDGSWKIIIGQSIQYKDIDQYKVGG